MHGWNNQGWTTAKQQSTWPESYGPICYDISPPLTTAAILNGPTLPHATSRTFTITLNPADQYSGVAATYYLLLGEDFPAPYRYHPYGGPLKIRLRHSAFLYFYSVDKAGNVEPLRWVRF